MVSNCTPLLVDLFLYLWEAAFIKELHNKSEKKLVRFFHFKMQLYRRFPWLNNCRFGDFLDRIYLIELKIKDTTDTYISASYLDLHLEIESEWRLKTEHYDKKMITIFPQWTFDWYAAAFHQRLYMEYISLSWSDISELVVTIRISLIADCY